MELNDGADISQHPFFIVDRQAVHSVETDGQSTDCSLNGSNFVAERKFRYPENDRQQIISSGLPQQIIPGFHQAKRHHFWSTNPHQPNSSDEHVLSSVSHADLQRQSFGYCEKANSVPMSFTVPFAGSDGAGSSNMPSSHSNLRPEVAPWQSSTMGTGTWNAQIGLHTDSNLHNSFPATSNDYWDTTGDLGSNSIRQSTTEDAKGKRLEYQNINTDVGGSVGPVTLGGASFNRYGSSAGNSGDFFGNLRPDQINGDLRGAYKRKLSTVDSAEAFDADAHMAGGNEGQSTGTSSDRLLPNRFINAVAMVDPSIRQIQNNPDSHNDYFKCVVDSYGVQQDSQRCPQIQNYSAFPGLNHEHLHSLLSRNSTASSLHADVRTAPEVLLGSTSTMPSMENWLSLFGERSSISSVSRNWSGNNVSRRGTSPIFCPDWSERIALNGMSEGRNVRSNPGRHNPRAATTVIENGFTNQSNLVENMITSAGRTVDPRGYNVRTREPLNGVLSPGSLSSFLAASGMNGHRLARNHLIPVPSRQLPIGFPLEVSLPSANQHGNWNPASFHRVRRDALLAGPVQSVLGLPFRGIGVLQTDREYRRQFLSEILTAMHHAFRTETLNIEDVVMLDSSSTVNSEIDVHDQYRDMRLDVDNMSYEELLALEERMGNVCTGLSNDMISLCLRENKYSSLDATVAAISEESDVKCTICQEEFIEEDELGTLDCGHGYHAGCIKHWLQQKNECPICKCAAMMKKE